MTENVGRAGPRPRQVALSGWLIVVSSVFVVMLAFDEVANLGSLETQQWAADILADPPLSGTGLSVADVQTITRIFSFIAAACGTAGAILGWYVTRGSRQARLALSILAPGFVVAGMAPAGFAAAVVVASTVMLWLQPARNWFAGKPPPPMAPRTGRAARAAATPLQGPAPFSAAATGGTSQAPRPAATHAPTHEPGFPPLRRPRNVTTAAIVTLAGSLTTSIYLTVSLLFVAGDREGLEREVQNQLDTMAGGEDFDAAMFADIAVWLMAGMVVWCVIASVLAALVLRGSNAARITLVVSASLAALASLLGALVILPLVITGACVATIVLLFTGGSNAWFSR
ncbi:hypothetical protein [Nocardioides sp. R-C-SC26]|uniref:hypothetical protein n=1 Tax=Nocardioides sp. R-C-SC26 TaxID=2870414 RepID=UPI001E5FA8C4|nr:hypothetical protein [Nocardioides sp. R-C-SC26]